MLVIQKFSGGKWFLHRRRYRNVSRSFLVNMEQDFEFIQRGRG
jgi:hypothetical protein